MPVGSHYFSWWYWYSIITYAYGHYFSGAINMCCDLGAFDLTSHACLLLAEACFKSVTSVFSRTNLVSLPSLTAPLKTRKFLFFFFENSRLIGLFRMVASDLADWMLAAIEGQSFALCLCGEVWGCHWKHAIFLYFCSLSPDTHEMQWSLQFVLMFFCFLFSKCKGRQKKKKKNELNQSHSEQSKQGQIACAFSDTVK